MCVVAVEGYRTDTPLLYCIKCKLSVCVVHRRHTRRISQIAFEHFHCKIIPRLIHSNEKSVFTLMSLLLVLKRKRVVGEFFSFQKYGNIYIYTDTFSVCMLTMHS